MYLTANSYRITGNNYKNSDLRVMSDAYEEFAKETYATTRSEIGTAVEGGGGLPVLVVSGNEHIDSGLERKLNYFTRDANEEPAMAGAYTHIAAIQASSDLVGAENVVVSFEFDQDKLDRRIEMVQRAINDDSVTLEDVLKEEGLEGRPVYYAMEYALREGHTLVASDPWHDAPSPTDPKRFDGEIEALGKQALRTEDRPDVVVHIGGSSHFGTLQGHDLRAVLNNGENMVRVDDLNPFTGIYGNTVFFNSYQAGAGDGIESGFNQGAIYARKDENAVQIDPPGQMDASDLENIAERVQAASAEMAEPALQSPVHIPESPAIGTPK